MSEFKFACPVCGQHITADSDSSGKPLECPTCFRQIIVPQAPSSATTKFILSATQANKPRPAAPEQTEGGQAAQQKPSRSSGPVLLAVVVLVCAAGAAAYFFRDKLPFKTSPHAQTTNATISRIPPPPPPAISYPIPTNIVWSLSLTNVEIPDEVAKGAIHGSGFVCERATLQGGSLSLRQGKNWPPDLAVNIVFFAKLGEELSQKTIEITPDRAPPIPKVSIRWKEGQKGMFQNIPPGYALKIVFGEAANGRMPGRLYIALPDEEKSFVAGTFDAVIQKLTPPRQPKPKPAPKPGAPGPPARPPA